MGDNENFLGELERMRGLVQLSGDDTKLGERVRMAELRAMFRTFLPEATEVEITEVACIQKEMRLQQSRLDNLLEIGVIDQTEFVRATTNEADWGFRRCARVLGHQRFELLFGIDAAHAARTHEVSLEPALLAHYQPLEAERREVVASLGAIDPQALDPVRHFPWAGQPKYGNVLALILKAESLYDVGDTQASLESTLNAIGHVTQQESFGEAGLYFASWAHHIEGKIYETRKHWESAASHYEASLSLKMRLGDWLPPTAMLATEVKLGGVEILQSPIQAVTRLERVVDVLQRRKGTLRRNPAFYDNLLEDSHLRLAQAYLGMGNEREVVRNANTALVLAEKLHDSPGEIQVMFVLYSASVLGRETLLNRLQVLLKRDPQRAKYPSVTRILELLG